MGAKEKVQLLKLQPPKHEDLNLFPRSHIRKEGMVVPKSSPSPEEGEIVGTLGLAAAILSGISKFQAKEKLCLKKI